ncbi:hypothetical protein H8A95_04710 [Bradyrhizobium sp. Pear76]|uniref:twin-arginine translocation signal domain-containing protein n=1 Tax=Bradyrhizobium oropedii TaxID=1571201 RepID=UPI001E64AA9C|nr:twin-arginine translocation signal domain-containing protein [Bradyrhizobium oropedii]MCC8961639.1 hypothetical protein [Bradyrhizobium oropedii]
MSEITRRNLLAGAAASAACAAMPTAAIAKQGLDLDRFLEVVIAETERLHPGVNADRRGRYLKSGQQPSSS